MQKKILNNAMLGKKMEFVDKKIRINTNKDDILSLENQKNLLIK